MNTASFHTYESINYHGFHSIPLLCWQARFPFLDEEVVETLLDLPLWDIVDLRLPIGSGDKRVLREVCVVH